LFKGAVSTAEFMLLRMRFYDKNLYETMKYVEHISKLKSLNKVYRRINNHVYSTVLPIPKNT